LRRSDSVAGQGVFSSQVMKYEAAGKGISESASKRKNAMALLDQERRFS